MAEDGTFLINGEPYVPTATTQVRTIKESPGTSITGWFQANKTTVYIVLGGAVIGLIVYFYFKNQQANSSSTAGTTDSTTGVSTLSGSPSSTDGSTPPGSPDFSQLETLLSSLQQAQASDEQSIQQLMKDESSEKKPTKKKPKPKKNKGGGAVGNEVYGSVFTPISSEYHQDMYEIRQPFRNTGHRIVYSLG